ncbi:MAG: LysR family transcriptional regulator [Alphaproteobacteria bacterium]|nr:LysR family transcriptional regulator [Alphaproteobacteria bacterium]
MPLWLKSEGSISPGQTKTRAIIHKNILFEASMVGLIPSTTNLRAFEAVGRHLSFTDAARELNLTQAAVSHRVKMLEAQLGVRLFVRRNRDVQLSPTGKNYLKTIRDLLRRLEQETARVMLPRQARRKKIKMLVVQAVASLWLAPRLSQFHALYPDIDVSIEISQSGFTNVELADLEKHEADAALGSAYDHLEWPELSTDPMIMDFGIPVCSPAFLREHRQALAKPEGLYEVNLLHAMSWPDVWDKWFACAKLKPPKPHRQFNFQHTGLSVQAAIGGLGVAMAHGPLVASELTDGRLIAPYPFRVQENRAYFFICRPTELRRPAVQALRDWIRTEMTEGWIGAVRRDPILRNTPVP